MSGKVSRGPVARSSEQLTRDPCPACPCLSLIALPEITLLPPPPPVSHLHQGHCLRSDLGRIQVRERDSRGVRDLCVVT